MKFPTLYKRTSTGAIQQWTIEVKGNTFFTKSGQVDGKIQTSKPTVCKGKNIGKKNESSPEEQAKVEAQAKYDKQLKSKYKVDIDRIDTADFISPTLASPLKDRKKPLVFPAFIQIKYNGVCCIIDTEFGSRTRTGEIFYNIKHVNRDLERFFAKNPDVVLHGELYNYKKREHLNQLIELVAVTRKEKDLTPELIAASEEIVEYYVYDGYVKGRESEPYEKRIKEITSLMAAAKLKYVFPAPTSTVESEEEALEFFQAALDDKQEGAILRMAGSPYLHKRSKDILKYKQSETAEFLCIGFKDAVGNWAGIAKKCVMLLPNGKTLDCNMKGTQEFLREVWENQEKYINKYYVCDFQNYSEYGIPQIAYTGLVERNYE